MEEIRTLITSLGRRLEALETRLEAPGRQAASGDAADRRIAESTRLDESSRPGGSAPPHDDDPFWALNALKERVDHPGGIVYAGSVTTAAGPVDWQIGYPFETLMEATWERHAAKLGALGHPARLALLHAVLGALPPPAPTHRSGLAGHGGARPVLGAARARGTATRHPLGCEEPVMTAQRKARLLGAIAAAVAVLLAGILVFPRPPALATPATGDPELVDRVRSLLTENPGTRDRLSIAVVDGDRVTEAHFGATADTEYEIGSVTKTMTASVFADMIRTGDVSADTRLGEVFDLKGAPAADITLEQLATHSSGLPRLPLTPEAVVSSLLFLIRANDPYGSTVPELVADARAAEPGPNTFEYSNFGFALLGQALATRAGTDYPTLLRERILDPLRMSDTFAPTSMADLQANAPTGYTQGGRPNDPWTLGADAPAGSVRSTTADMVRYLRAQLDGSAPGGAATKARADAGPTDRIGFAWISTGDITWHNGGTGGFSSWVSFDRTTGRGVVVLSNTAVSVDEIGLALMDGGNQ
ncbi:hypothetical protein FQR65_LT20109 [Abscondita terminalis]|nr:hypothetical protein FQR65_LT20109 [Abscondita terminalis]